MKTLSDECSERRTLIRGHEGRIARHRRWPAPGCPIVVPGAGEGLGVAGAVDREAAGARVADRIAAAASHEPETFGDGDRHRDAVVVELVDLAVLVDPGHGEHDDENGQGHQTEADHDLTDFAGVVVDAGPPQRREGLVGRPGRAGGSRCGSGALIGLSIPLVGSCASGGCPAATR
jgi:hypothetical protein